jgi:ClpP class serine protease
MLQGKPANFTSPLKHTDNGKLKSDIERSGSEGISRPFVIDPVSMQQFDAYKFDYNAYKYIPNPNIPPNSVAIISVCSPITKYNGDCGEPGSIQLSNYIMEMNRLDNIGSIVMIVDTPGGEARAANAFVSAIQKSKKPILSFIDGMSASLGVWLTSASDEVYFSNKMDQLGSIGSYCTLFDFSAYFEKEGIKIHEIYAPQSIDKNKDYKDAIAGDYSAIKNDLKIHVDGFISFVKTSRGDKAAANQSAWDSGKMFYADEAVKLGLADGIKSFEQVISKAAWLAKRKK